MLVDFDSIYEEHLKTHGFGHTSKAVLESKPLRGTSQPGKNPNPVGESPQNGLFHPDDAGSDRVTHQTGNIMNSEPIH